MSPSSSDTGRFLTIKASGLMGAVTFLALVHPRSVCGDFYLTWCLMMSGTLLLDEGNVRILFAYVGYVFCVCRIRLLHTLYGFGLPVVVYYSNNFPVE